MSAIYKIQDLDFRIINLAAVLIDIFIVIATVLYGRRIFGITIIAASFTAFLIYGVFLRLADTGHSCGCFGAHESANLFALPYSVIAILVCTFRIFRLHLREQAWINGVLFLLLLAFTFVIIWNIVQDEFRSRFATENAQQNGKNIVDVYDGLVDRERVANELEKGTNWIILYDPNCADCNAFRSRVGLMAVKNQVFRTEAFWVKNGDDFGISDINPARFFHLLKPLRTEKVPTVVKIDYGIISKIWTDQTAALHAMNKERGESPDE